MASVPESLQTELIRQSLFPPGNDRVLGYFYESAVQQIDDRDPLFDVVTTTLNQREITPPHLANLLYRAYQFIKFEQNDLSYGSYTQPSQFREDLNEILTDEQTRPLYQSLLLTRSTSTTVYQRYAGIAAVVAHIYDGQPVVLADFGCGGNYGLRGIELREFFDPIEDQTPNGLFTRLVEYGVNLKRGIAIDKENPDDEANQKWRMACRFYPQELSQRQSVMDREERLRQSQKVEFYQADLASYVDLPSVQVDAVSLCTMLYQLPLPEQVRTLKNARRLLKDGGVIIVQDFASKNIKNPTKLNCSESWGGSSFGYRTFIASEATKWQFLEALQFNGGRATQVKAGEDFEEVFSSKYQIYTRPGTSLYIAS